MAVAAGYYDIPIGNATGKLACALYGYPVPRSAISASPRTIPIVEWLSEAASSVRRDICADRPEEMRHFKSNKRAGPESALFFYALSEVEGATIAKLSRTPPGIKGNMDASYSPPSARRGGRTERARDGCEGRERGETEEMKERDETEATQERGMRGIDGGRERRKRGNRGREEREAREEREEREAREESERKARKER